MCANATVKSRSWKNQKDNGLTESISHVFDEMNNINENPFFKYTISQIYETQIKTTHYAV